MAQISRSTRRKLFLSLATAQMLASAHWASAVSYTWNTVAAPTSGNWSVTANWTPTPGTGGPAAADSAVLTNASGSNLTIVYDSTNGALTTLSISPLGSNVVELDEQKPLSLSANPLALGTGIGTSDLLMDPAAGGTTLKFTASTVTVANAGILEMANYSTAAAGATTTQLTGNLAINSGGTLQIDEGVLNAASLSTNLQNIITGSLSMGLGGTINLDNHTAPSNSFAANSGGTAETLDKLQVNGNLTITGGTFTAGGADASGLGANQFTLAGLTNSISGLTGNGAITPLLTEVETGTSSMSGNLVVSLQSDSALNGGLALRNSQTTPTSGTQTLTYQVGPATLSTLQVGQIELTSHTATTTTMQLTGNVSSSFIPTVVGSNNTNPIFAIDLNGNTLNLSGANASETLPNTNTSTSWSLVNSAGSGSIGTIEAAAFNLSAPKGGSSIGSYTNLDASAGSLTTNLGDGYGGTIDPASTFTYDPTVNIANAATLTTSATNGTANVTRNIGNLTVQAGTLLLGSGITTGATSATTVTAGTLNLNGNPLSTQTLFMSGGTINLDNSTATIGDIAGSGGVIYNSVASTVDTLVLGNGNAGGGSFSGTIKDNLGSGGTIAISKIGSGIITLSGQNTYSGGTTIAGGTLYVNNTTNSGTGTGSVSVTTGTLGGTGTISGAVTLGASAGNGAGTTITPGTASTPLATLNTGPVTLHDNATFAVTLNSDTTSSSGLLNVTGAISLSDTSGALLSVADLGTNTSFVAGRIYTIIASTVGVTGNFANLAPGATVTASNGSTYTIQYGATNVTLDSVTAPTPEPGMLGLLSFAGLLLRRRRQVSLKD